MAVLSVSALLVTTGCGSQIPPIFAYLANNGGNFKIIAIRKGTTLNQELIVGPQAKENIKTVAVPLSPLISLNRVHEPTKLIR